MAKFNLSIPKFSLSKISAPKVSGKKLSIDFQQSPIGKYDKNQGVYQVIDNRIKHIANKPYLKYKIDDQNWDQINARQFDRLAIQVAKGLVAKGLKPQDTVAIMGKTSFNWLLVDSACAMIGIVVAPIYETNSAQQIDFIIRDAKVRLSFVDNTELYQRVESVITKDQDYLGTYVFEENAIQQLIALGEKVPTKKIEELKGKVKSDDLLTIVYTSGSTGTPKGVELTHGAMTSIVVDTIDVLPLILRNKNGRFFLFLPLAHIFARYAFWTLTNTELSIGISGNIATLLDDLRVIKPTITIVVPRIFEKVYNASSQKAGGGIKGVIFKEAVKTAITYSKQLDEPDGVQPDIFLKHKLFDQLVYANIRQALGGKVEWIVCGGAPLSNNLSHFFRGAGVPILEGYGLTESAAPIFVSRESANRIGTIGYPFPSVEYKIDAEGNLLVKSPQLFRGYHNDPEATKSVFVDGWFKTGDLVQDNGDGTVTITGRSKDVIITAGGKNISPLVMEGSLKDNLLISQAVLVGDRKPYISCLITLDPEQFEIWQKKNNLKISKHEIPTNPVLRGEIQRMIDKTNALVSRAESIKKFEILPDDFSEENGLLTASMKLKRNKVYEKYQDLIETKLYGK